MIYSSACAYAIRALSRLALLRPDGYALLDELCEGSDLPKHFVAKIFQDLCRKGLLQSAKGRGGGFAFARSPSKITLYEIVEAVDGTEDFEACVVGFARCDSKQPCPLHNEWKGIRNSLREYLQRTTLTDMSDALGDKMKSLRMPLPTLNTPSKPISR